MVIILQVNADSNNEITAEDDNEITAKDESMRAKAWNGRMLLLLSESSVSLLRCHGVGASQLYCNMSSKIKNDLLKTAHTLLMQVLPLHFYPKSSMVFAVYETFSCGRSIFTYGFICITSMTSIDGKMFATSTIRSSSLHPIQTERVILISRNPKAIRPAYWSVSW